jgi:hypothetical protein
LKDLGLLQIECIAVSWLLNKERKIHNVDNQRKKHNTFSHTQALSELSRSPGLFELVISSNKENPAGIHAFQGHQEQNSFKLVPTSVDPIAIEDVRRCLNVPTAMCREAKPVSSRSIQIINVTNCLMQRLPNDKIKNRVSVRENMPFSLPTPVF